MHNLMFGCGIYKFDRVRVCCRNSLCLSVACCSIVVVVVVVVVVAVGCYNFVEVD